MLACAIFKPLTQHTPHKPSHKHPHPFTHLHLHHHHDYMQTTTALVNQASQPRGQGHVLSFFSFPASSSSSSPWTGPTAVKAAPTAATVACAWTWKRRQLHPPLPFKPFYNRKRRPWRQNCKGWRCCPRTRRTSSTASAWHTRPWSCSASKNGPRRSRTSFPVCWERFVCRFIPSAGVQTEHASHLGATVAAPAPAP